MEECLDLTYVGSIAGEDFLRATGASRTGEMRPKASTEDELLSRPPGASRTGEIRPKASMEDEVVARPPGTSKTDESRPRLPKENLVKMPEYAEHLRKCEGFPGSSSVTLLDSPRNTDRLDPIDRRSLVRLPRTFKNAARARARGGGYGRRQNASAQGSAARTRCSRLERVTLLAPCPPAGHTERRRKRGALSGTGVETKRCA
eukprot:5899338-Prymnesium_polylepis.1